jgi:hypothetical protein
MGRLSFMEAVDAVKLTAISQFFEVGTSVNIKDWEGPELATPLHSCVDCGGIATA